MINDIILFISSMSLYEIITTTLKSLFVSLVISFILDDIMFFIIGIFLAVIFLVTGIIL